MVTVNLFSAPATGLAVIFGVEKELADLLQTLASQGDFDTGAGLSTHRHQGQQPGRSQADGLSEAR